MMCGNIGTHMLYVTRCWLGMCVHKQICVQEYVQNPCCMT